VYHHFTEFLRELQNKENFMKNFSKRVSAAVLTAVLFFAIGSAGLFALGKGGAKADAKVAVTEITLAAAASLKNAFDGELVPLFEKKYPAIKVVGTYDSSGKLQTQIEQGLGADVFFSAAVRQMNALVDGGFINRAAVNDLLQNKLVLIKKKGGVTKVSGFNTVQQAGSIALGDPESVPAGQYAQEAFTKLGNWAAVQAKKPSLGTNVTEVLSWVAAGSAEVGVVYATDAASNPDVEIIAELGDGVLSAPVVYPVAPLAKSAHPVEAAALVDFLASPEGIAVFKKFGFSENK
jgi:molybdate transport system substrate-binding protein